MVSTHAGMWPFLRVKAARQTLLSKGDEKHAWSLQNNPVLSMGGRHAFPVNIIIWNYGATCNMEVKLDFIVGFTQIPAFCRVDVCPWNTVREWSFPDSSFCRNKAGVCSLKVLCRGISLNLGPCRGKKSPLAIHPRVLWSMDGYRQANRISLMEMDHPREYPRTVGPSREMPLEVSCLPWDPLIDVASSLLQSNTP